MMSSTMISTCNRRVAVLYTGGTIGMKRTDGGLKPVGNLAEELAGSTLFHDHTQVRPAHNTLVLPKYGDREDRVEYTIFEYNPLLDSSNMSIKDYKKIAKDVKDYYETYDGFVILHGTDTMSYTASALSFMFENLGKTVIITGSQIPIFELRSDGRDNLMAALILAAYHSIPEVTLLFCNKLLRGNRSTKLNCGAIDAFHSMNIPPLVELEIDIKVHKEAIIRPKGNAPFRVNEDMCEQVGVLTFYPTITASMIKAFLQRPLQGVVLQTYGSGNGPDDRKKLFGLLKKATDRGVIIVNVTQCEVGSVTDSYETGQALSKINVIPGGDMTTEAALMKLCYVLEQSQWDLQTKKEMIKKNLRGEITVLTKENVELELVNELVLSMSLSSNQEKIILKDALLPPLLCSAAKKNDRAYMEKLIQAGADIGPVTDGDPSPLHIATCEGHTDMVDFLTQQGADIHAKDSFGNTPLDNAIQFKHLEIIDRLRSSGACVNLPQSKLAMAINNEIIYGDIKGIEALHRAGVDFNQRDREGRTPLHVAESISDIDKVRMLRECGATPDVIERL